MPTNDYERGMLAAQHRLGAPDGISTRAPSTEPARIIKSIAEAERALVMARINELRLLIDTVNHATEIVAALPERVGYYAGPEVQMSITSALHSLQSASDELRGTLGAESDRGQVVIANAMSGEGSL